ncbi:hypothetical protein OQA88_8164 [Cercophora sp. LCS_1]
MEVAGFAAAVVAFAKTTRSTSHLVKRIYYIAKNAPLIEEQLLQTAIPLKSFIASVKAVHTSLEHHCPDDSESKVIQYIIQQGLPKDLRKQSAHVEQSVSQLKHRISRLNSRWGDLVTSFKWTRLRPELEAMFAPMESLKTTLTLILQVVILEVKTGQYTGTPSEEMKAEMRVSSNFC